MITRQLSALLSGKTGRGKAIILIGARQTGKTTLLKELTANQPDVLWLNADDIAAQELLHTLTIARLQPLFGKYRTIVIDEAQRVADIGLRLKLITDNMPEVQLLVTGSSALELANRVNEPLTGRKYEYHLYPFSFHELQIHHGMVEEIAQLPVRLVYGSYPEVVNTPGEAKVILSQLANSYLYRDVLEWERIKRPEKLLRLLQALAFQLAGEVSYNELSRLVGLDKDTVADYITLLEQAQVIFRIGSFSRNLRKELRTARKIYFYDNGIRNALIGNFTDVNLRADTGALWENYLVSERLKRNANLQQQANMYFWRTVQQQEIDYIEEADGQLHAFEFKWNAKKNPRLTKTFRDAYPDATFSVITPDNYFSFLGCPE